MEEWISYLYSFAVLVGFILAACFFVPGGVKSYQEWKKTGKMIYLSGSVSCFVAAFYLFIGVFLYFIKPFIRYLQI